MTKVPNKESFEQKLAVLDRLHAMAGSTFFDRHPAPSPADKEHAEYQIDRKTKAVYLVSWDEDHHNGGSYNTGSRRLTDEEASALLDRLTKEAEALAVKARVEWIKGEEERAILARAQADVDCELSEELAAKAEAAMRKLEHHKLVLEVPGGAKIEELLNLSISYEVSVDEDGDEFYIYDVDLFGERVSSSATKPAVAMRLLSEHIAVHLRGLADDIASAAEES